MKKEIIKTITDKEFGLINVILKPNKRAITLTIKPEKGIVISAPHSITQSTLLEVIEKRRVWLRKHLESIYQKKKHKSVFSPDIDFKTRQHRLVLEKHAVPKITSSVSHGVIRVVIPFSINWEEETVQNAIQKAIIEALRIEAHQYLPVRLYELSQKYHFKISGLNIKNMKTRWGSCSSRGNINLSIFLMLLPNHLIDHILLHELCHLREMNHGKNFKSLLLSLDPEMKQHTAELKKIQIGDLFFSNIFPQ